MLIPNAFTALAALSTLAIAVPLPSNINTLQLLERSAVNVPTTIIIDQEALSKRMWYPQMGSMLGSLKALPQTVRGKIFGKPQTTPQPKWTTETKPIKNGDVDKGDQFFDARVYPGAIPPVPRPILRRMWYPQMGSMLGSLKALPQTVRGKLFGKPQTTTGVKLKEGPNKNGYVHKGEQYYDTHGPMI